MLKCMAAREKEPDCTGLANACSSMPSNRHDLGALTLCACVWCVCMIWRTVGIKAVSAYVCVHVKYLGVFCVFIFICVHVTMCSCICGSVCPRMCASVSFWAPCESCMAHGHESEARTGETSSRCIKVSKCPWMFRTVCLCDREGKSER